MADDEGFLSRWSRRKLEKKHEEDEAVEAPAEAAEAPAGSGQGGGDAAEADAEERERHPAEDIDIDALTKDSDFTIFMQKGVPKAVRQRALRKLWTSDPVLANLDGLLDYDDLTKTHGQGPLDVATAWKIGRGFLTDEEIGLNAKDEDGEAAAEASGDAAGPTPAEEGELAERAVPDPAAPAAADDAGEHEDRTATRRREAPEDDIGTESG